MRKTILFCTIIMILTGCTSPRQMTLFSSKSSAFAIDKAPLFVIAPNDELVIIFSAVNIEAVSQFNSAGTTYHVNSEGMVDIPVLGKIKLEGKTTEEAVEYLTDLVRDQVKNPVVRMDVTNAAISILGEVRTPARWLIDRPISLPQAIGMVGGFTKNAQLKSVLVQRCEHDSITQYHVNLLTDELFTSPAYYLQKGDVVNVAPLHAK